MKKSFHANVKKNESYSFMEGKYHFLSFDKDSIIKQLGKKKLLKILQNILLSRTFERYAEEAYHHGKIGGFFHSSIGQEAISSAAAEAFGLDNWYTATYRCHSIYLMLGGSTDELMAELYGKVAGNAKGRGGSMHVFLKNMLGGFGIVGGHVPIATGAAFSCKYKKEKDKISICFLGDGSVAQGSFHESMNIASLWSLPCLYIIENNRWGMGTAVDKAICVQPIAENFAPSFGMKGYSVDGMDFFSCFHAFSKLSKEIKKDSRPIIIEALTARFRGHSISDPSLYRSKDLLEKRMEKDPILLLKKTLIKKKMLTEKEYAQMEEEQRQKIKAAMKFADNSSWPDMLAQEKDVYVKEED